MHYKPGTHGDEDVLEGYSLRSLPEPELDAFEEHLLVCPRCQDRLAEADSYVRAMRSGAAELRQDPLQGGDFGIGSLLRRMVRPGPAIALAVVAVAVVAVFRLPQPHGAAPVPVRLEAYRSASASAVRAGRVLEISLDAAGLPELPVYTVQVVQATGVQLFETGGQRLAGTILVPVRRSLPAGAYWVRVYDSSHTLLREYGLAVK